MTRRPGLRPFATATLAAWLLGVALAGGAAAQGTVRAEVAKPLQAAQELGKAGKAKEALDAAAEADGVKDLTPFERYMIQRIKAPLAVAAGDSALAISLFEAAYTGGQMPSAEKAAVAEVGGKLAYQAKDYAKAIAWINRYRADGGVDPQTLMLVPQAMYLSGDHAGAARELQPMVQADEAAGRATPEITLRLLASAQNQAKDMPGYLRTLERIAVAYPKPEIWAELIARAANRPNFSDRLRLDYYRLLQATGNLKDAADLGDLAQLALLAGLPAEAKRALEAGAAAGIASTPELQKLSQQATSAAAKDQAGLADNEKAAAAAKDGDPLFGLGFALVGDGQAEKGAALMAQGVAKGGLKRPDEARLHLGIAQFRAGKADEAIASFQQVKGEDGSAELARVWTLFLRANAKK